jgi:hypothetical protein
MLILNCIYWIDDECIKFDALRSDSNHTWAERAFQYMEWLLRIILR